MTNPLLQLAFSMQRNKGVYALLLGSGVSRSAGVPTGWGLMLDVIGKIAQLEGETPTDPVQWYTGKYGKKPLYDDLLAKVANTPAERQGYLKPYFEFPDGDEKGKPTRAHRAIAQLMKNGSIRVVVTTNFDRLLEQALTEIGVTPAVIANSDQAKGALPLVHQQHCIIKVHGDYLDTRIRNVSDELKQYEPEMDALLDQVFDAFGLVICGWSGEWDQALRAALERSPNRRFSTYWATQGTLSEKGARLLEHRQGQTIPIADADQFFGELQDKVEALEKIENAQHPMTARLAVETLKKYLPNPLHRIQAEDLIQNELERIATQIRDQRFNNNESVDNATEQQRMQFYCSICETLTALGVVAGAYADTAFEPVLFQTMDSLLRMASNESGYTVWNNLKYLPAQFWFYAVGIGAAQKGRFDLLKRWLLKTVPDSYNPERRVHLLERLHAQRVIENREAKTLIGDERNAASSRLLLQNMLPALNAAILSLEVDRVFEQLEFYVSMGLWVHARRNQGEEKKDTALGYWNRNHCGWDQYLYELTQADSETQVAITALFGSEEDRKACLRHLNRAKESFWP
ncbi:MAG TPA: SIR2 family protein [Fibrobacteraceae bacterium]|nr:SIR2 family protein [Fibrobacteraceae bacterium]